MSYYTKGTHYDLLEVGLRASQPEINEAYRRQMEMLNGESLATYGLFVGEDLEEARSRVEDAHQVLSQPARRRVYDLAEFNQSFVSPGAARRGQEAAEATDAADEEYNTLPDLPREVARKSAGKKAEQDVSAQGETGTRSKNTDSKGKQESVQEPWMKPRAGEPLDLASFDGASMRAVREQERLSLEDISAQSKINEFYLQCIENERFSQLPPPIYLRSYVKQYAELIGLDAEKAADGFLARYNTDVEDNSG